MSSTQTASHCRVLPSAKHLRCAELSTPTVKMVFTVLGAVAELERSLIAERVRAGLRNARAKGKRLGRPRVPVDAAQIARLRAQGRPIRDIAAQLGCSSGLVHKTLANSLR
jgi:DNA invertase Pin-like site-specific DNA recombinase